MKWGIRRFQNKDGTRTPAGKKRYGDDSDDVKKSENTKPPKTKKRTVTDLSDTELREKINRLELEKRYKSLVKEQKSSPSAIRGKKFVVDVLENSAKNIATQTVTYAMGTGVNAAAKKIFNLDIDIINPKKGQKDK